MRIEFEQRKRVLNIELPINNQPQTTGKKRRKDRILDAAEELFAKRGFDGVTLRQIAALAEVDLALASYHFGRKRALFDAVLLRRAEILNKVRNDALDACLAAAGDQPPTVEAIIDAYLTPLGEIQNSGDKGWRNYYALVAWVNNSAEWGKELMTLYFNPLVLRFIDALKLALPDTDEESLYWGYHYLSGALTLTFAETHRIDELSKGAANASDLKSAYAHMIPFIAAGFQAICAQQPGPNT